MLNQLIETILDYVEVDNEITAETKIKTDLGMSSFDLVCLATDINDRFNVSLNADDFRKCESIGALAEMIEQRNAK